MLNIAVWDWRDNLPLLTHSVPTLCSKIIETNHIKFIFLLIRTQSPKPHAAQREPQRYQTPRPGQLRAPRDHQRPAPPGETGSRHPQGARYAGQRREAGLDTKAPVAHVLWG